MKLLYTVEEAAEVTGLSPESIKYAITQKRPTRDKTTMRKLPRLRARKATGIAYRITLSDLTDWVDSLPDYE